MARLPCAFALFLALSLPAFAQAPSVRIGLAEAVPRTTLATSVGGAIVDATGRILARTRAMEALEVKREGAGVALYGSMGRVASDRLPLRLVSLPDAGEVGLVFGAGRWYRGEMELRATGHRLTLVNHVPLEHYLYGVVPAEMNPRWPLESLKAQAVAARTYALAKLGQFASRGYDMKPTTENQVYRGAGVERVPSNMAVDQTLGQVLTHGGRVIAAYFHSSSGGFTETGAAVWGEPRPYLQAVPDFDQQSPRYLWQKNLGAPELRHALDRKGVRVGELLRFEVLERTYSGRVKRVRVVGTQGQADVSGDAVRQAAGLYSTLFNVLGYGGGSGRPAAFAFAGRGHGHGLGLSQWGAKSLGERGYGYAQILAHYYPNSQLSSITSEPRALLSEPRALSQPQALAGGIQ
ncbi:MAG TPA: SpoIID/LytB domain-containing protein [Pantanalinema sp.]